MQLAEQSQNLSHSYNHIQGFDKLCVPEKICNMRKTARLQQNLCNTLDTYLVQAMQPVQGD